MSFTLLNQAAYCLQIACVVALGAALPFAFRLRSPKARLAYWHILLIVCIALPVLQQWRTPPVVVVSYYVAAGAPAAGALDTLAAGWSWYDSLVWLLIAGMAARFLWLVVGIVRLQRYRRAATPFETHAHVEVLISHDVSGPVTFGVRRPVILLPPEFPALAPEVQRAMVTHELIHIERRDWLVVLAEETVRALFWFHPAIWWLLGRIQLTREQVVDRDAIERTGESQSYLDALVVIASRKFRPDLAPAPLFLKKRHLRQRVASIVKGVNMSKRRTVLSLIAILCALPVVIGVAAWRFPLTAQAQGVADEAGVQVQTGGWSVLHRSGILYPAEARQKGLSGTVTVAVTTDDKGEVTDAKVTGGPEELRKPVLQSVLTWHFAVQGAQTFQVAVRFDAPAGAQGGIPAAPMPETAHNSVTVERLDLKALPLALRDKVAQASLIHEGDVVSPERFAEISRSLAAIDSHLRMSGPLHGDRVTMRVFLQPDRTAPAAAIAPPASIRVGGNVQAANLLEQVKPEYPALAKVAHIQGTVRFNVVIGKDGHVENIALESGHPLLVQAAQEAVQQWVYKPILLNGQPVAVITTVDVNFTLAK